MIIILLSLCRQSKRALWMTDEEALKAREAELLENLNFFLMNYRRLLANGYRKQVLDDEIKLIQLELDKLKEIT